AEVHVLAVGATDGIGHRVTAHGESGESRLGGDTGAPRVPDGRLHQELPGVVSVCQVLRVRGYIGHVEPPQGLPSEPIPSRSLSTGNHTSHVAVLKSGALSRIDSIDGPGRRRQGLDGNHSVAVAAHIDCSAAGCSPEARKTTHSPSGTSMTSRSSGTSSALRTATPCR